jgi:hypothetical protein
MGQGLAETLLQCLEWCGLEIKFLWGQRYNSHGILNGVHHGRHPHAV